MASKAVMLWVTMIIMLTVCDTMCEMSAKSKAQVSSGISGGEKLVTFFSKLGDPKVNEVFDSLGKMASFLGAAGGLISFALLFIPQSESVELKFMKKKFAEVNLKLDRITSELDNVKDLITYETQRAAYVGSASKILFAHKQLSVFLNELQRTQCRDKKSCKRIRARIASRYVDDFNVKSDIFKILNGCMNQTSVFVDPFLGLIKKTFKCHVGKIQHFANGVLKLSFKAQQVILAREKLLGSNFSITQSMNDWLNVLYELRSSTYNTKKQCFDNISDYMIKDINDKKYQVGVASNDQANQEVKKFMEEKYKWLGWVVHSYGAYGKSKHCLLGVYGKFWNMPSDKNKRKRNLIVSLIDNSGTYANQKYRVLNAIDNIVKNTNFYSVGNDACKLLRKVEEELKKKGVWKYITSLNVLRKYDGLALKADNDLTYISEEYTFKPYFNGNKVRLVITLKSLEQANGGTCDKSCGKQGRCATPPYSSAKYCQCKPFFQGDKCQEGAKAQLAKTVDAMLETTLKLPMLSDIAYDIQDLREYVGISFGSVQSAISELEATFKKAFDDLRRKLTSHFKWSNLITHYSNAMRKIEYYAHRFEELPKRYPTTLDIEGKKLATAVLAPDGIEKWLYELNFLFLGRTGAPLLNHESLMIVFMNRYSSQACSPTYKAAVDNTWRQLVLLQQMGFILWAQALEIKGRPTEHCAQLYDTRTAKQVSAFNQTTCQYNIPNSVNVNCSGNGRYVHPTMSVINQCKVNYYLTGTAQTTCVSKASGCSPCNCNATGSNGSECSDQSGQCSCKSGFYGKKCEHRHCVWGPWSSYSSCSKSCDYGGSKTKTRSHQVTKQGQGKSCNGSSTHTTSCFNGCCSAMFHCSNRQKCIPWSYKCDYDNDCGDKQDEWPCSERCTTKYTNFNSHGGGDMVYFDRHRINCGGSGKVLQMFHLERSGGSIRFKYTCCTLNKIVCKLARKTNGFTYDGNGDTVYLDRQTVSCGVHSYLNDYWLERNRGHDHVRYNYFCCDLNNHKHRTRTRCYTSYTSFTYDGNGKSYYLDRQTVRCQSRYFLTYFKLERNSRHDHWRYRYRCCRIQV